MQCNALHLIQMEVLVIRKTKTVRILEKKEKTGMVEKKVKEVQMVQTLQKGVLLVILLMILKKSLMIWT